MEDINDQFSKLLNREWLENEKEIIESIMTNIQYYKRLLPNSLKSEISKALVLCNDLKNELDKLKLQVEFLENRD